MKKGIGILFSISALIPCSVFAGAMGVVAPEWNTVITVSAGPAWANSSMTQNVAIEPDLINTYVARKSDNVIANGELFLGVQHPVNEWLAGQIGVAVSGTSNINLQGDIWVDGDPDFNNFTYYYKASHTQVSLKGKLLAQNIQLFQPYVSASVGGGFNHSSSYQAIRTIPESVTPPPFQNHTVNTFSYTAGAGIQRTYAYGLQLGVGYEFASWGKSSLSAAAGQQLNNALYLKNVYTNQLQFSLTKLF